MGTLGCINDMMRRDKENRELRRASRERLNETRNRLLDVKGKRSECNVSYEQLEHIAHETREWEEKERNSFLKGKLVFITLLAGIVLLSPSPGTYSRNCRTRAGWQRCFPVCWQLTVSMCRSSRTIR